MYSKLLAEPCTHACLATCHGVRCMFIHQYPPLVDGEGRNGQTSNDAHVQEQVGKALPHVLLPALSRDGIAQVSLCRNMGMGNRRISQAAAPKWVRAGACARDAVFRQRLRSTDPSGRSVCNGPLGAPPHRATAQDASACCSSTHQAEGRGRAQVVGAVLRAAEGTCGSS